MTRADLRPWLTGAALAAPLALLAPAAAACSLTKVGELRMTSFGRPVVTGEINGRPVQLLADTGSAQHVILGPHAEKLGLTSTAMEGVRLYGVGGPSVVRRATVDELKLDAVAARAVPVLVTATGSASVRSDLAGVIGGRLFAQYDTEFDLAEGVIRFFTSQGCKGPEIAYWPGHRHQAALLGDPARTGRFNIEVKLNGRPMVALVDTGASTSAVTTDAARRAGVRTTDEGVRRALPSTGFGTRRVPTWLAVFDSLRVGDETIRSARLHVADLFGDNRVRRRGSMLTPRLDNMPSVLLGADFFHSHRVMISPGQKRMYFSYRGGPVFQAYRRPRTAQATADPAGG